MMTAIVAFAIFVALIVGLLFMLGYVTTRVKEAADEEEPPVCPPEYESKILSPSVAQFKSYMINKYCRERKNKETTNSGN